MWNQWKHLFAEHIKMIQNMHFKSRDQYVLVQWHFNKLFLKLNTSKVPLFTRKGEHETSIALHVGAFQDFVTGELQLHLSWLLRTTRGLGPTHSARVQKTVFNHFRQVQRFGSGRFGRQCVWPSDELVRELSRYYSVKLVYLAEESLLADEL